jgi:hypothetical protein
MSAVRRATAAHAPIQLSICASDCKSLLKISLPFERFVRTGPSCGSHPDPALEETQMNAITDKSYASRSSAARGLRRAIDSDATLEGRYIVAAVDDRWQIVAASDDVVMLAIDSGDLGLVPADKAIQHAREVADAENVAVTIRHPETDALIDSVEPNGQARARTRRETTADQPVARTNGKAKAAAPAGKCKATTPRGKVAAILRLASRKSGVSVSELNQLTGWRRAPWRWLFSNKKKTGYCDRWRLRFEAVRQEEGVRYFVRKL